MGRGLRFGLSAIPAEASEQLFARCVAVQAEEIHVFDRREEPLGVAFAHANGDQNAFLTGRVSRESGHPFRGGKVLSQVDLGEHSDGPVGLLDCAVDLLHEVDAGAKVPRLDDRPEARALDLPRDPLRPRLILSRVADEDPLSA